MSVCVRVFVFNMKCICTLGCNQIYEYLVSREGFSEYTFAAVSIFKDCVQKYLKLS